MLPLLVEGVGAAADDSIWWLSLSFRTLQRIGADGQRSHPSSARGGRHLMRHDRVHEPRGRTLATRHFRREREALEHILGDPAIPKGEQGSVRGGGGDERSAGFEWLGYTSRQGSHSAGRPRRRLRGGPRSCGRCFRQTGNGRDTKGWEWKGREGKEEAGRRECNPNSSAAPMAGEAKVAQPVCGSSHAGPMI